MNEIFNDKKTHSDWMKYVKYAFSWTPKCMSHFKFKYVHNSLEKLPVYNVLMDRCMTEKKLPRVFAK